MLIVKTNKIKISARRSCCNSFGCDRKFKKETSSTKNMFNCVPACSNNEAKQEESNESPVRPVKHNPKERDLQSQTTPNGAQLSRYTIALFNRIEVAQCRFGHILLQKLILISTFSYYRS